MNQNYLNNTNICRKWETYATKGTYYSLGMKRDEDFKPGQDTTMHKCFTLMFNVDGEKSCFHLRGFHIPKKYKPVRRILRDGRPGPGLNLIRGPKFHKIKNIYYFFKKLQLYVLISVFDISLKSSKQLASPCLPNMISKP